jgi:DNA-binding beta-propeller fold protein YncE
MGTGARRRIAGSVVVVALLGLTGVVGPGRGSGAVGAQASAEPAVFVPLEPVRILDTRTGIGAPVGALAPGSTIALQVAGAGGVPAGATGVVLNLTVTQANGAGFVTAFPSGTVQPEASVLNYTPGEDIANMVTARLGAGGALDLYNSQADVHLVADVAGYLVPGSGGGPSGPQGPTGAQGPPGPAGAAGPAGPRNRLTDEQIALGQWWLDPGAPARIATGDVPKDVVFDGTHVWVSSLTNIVKIDPASKAVVDTVALTNTGDMTFDGAHIWATRFPENTVEKIDPATGDVVATVPVPNFPVGVTFGAGYVWVARYQSDDVVRIDPGTNAIVGSPIAVGDTPQTALYDGQYVWVANANSNTLTRIDPASLGAPQTYPTGFRPSGMAFDGRHLWVAHWSEGSVGVYDPDTGAQVTTIATDSQGEDIAYDGWHMWVAHFGNNTVTKIDATTHQVIAELDAVDDIGTQPIAVAFDGANIWVANYNGGGPGSVTKLVAR